MSDVVFLTIDGDHGRADVEVDVRAGGRIAQIVIRGRELLVDPGDREPASTGWGAYPMAPWAGRIRHGRFRFLDTDVELACNHHDDPDHDPDHDPEHDPDHNPDHDGPDADGPDAERQHAIHGTVFSRRWTVESCSDESVTMRCPLGPGPDDPVSGWTFGGTARQTIELLDGQLRCDLSIEVDHREPTEASPTGASPAATSPAVGPFLGEIGWHPWFRTPSSISFHPDAMYERDAIGVPTGRLVVPTTGPWDDCFVNSAPVTLHFHETPDDRSSDPASVASGPSSTGPVTTVTLSSDCDHWVVYDLPEHAICVEPQSGPPDAFNIRPRLVTATHPLRRTMNIAW